MRFGLVFLLCALPLASGHAADGALASSALKPETISDTREVAASVEGTENAAARARTPGTVEKVFVSRGAHVKKGQIMALVRDNRTAVQMETMNQQVEAMEKALKLAETQAARLRKLLETDAASQAEVDAADAQALQARAAWTAADGQRKQVAEELAQGKLIAPMDGEVAMMNLVTGTVVMPGEMMIHVATRPLQVRMDVPERHAALMKKGDPVTLYGLEADGVASTGTIDTVYPSVLGGSATVMVSATGLDGKFIGQKLTALVTTGSHTGLLVPLKALTQRDGLTFATVKGAGRVVIRTGKPLPNGTVEVLSGLKAGDILDLPAPTPAAPKPAEQGKAQ